MITMEKHLGQLVSRGVITRDTAVQFANDPSQLQLAPGVPAAA
jgi:Tfp pilus assembly pilus retraction ATPase PilT